MVDRETLELAAAVRDLTTTLRTFKADVQALVEAIKLHQEESRPAT